MDLFSANVSKYRVYVTWVDHGTFIQDIPSEASLSSISHDSGRNFRVTGFRLDGTGDSLKYNITVPQEIQGSFKLPQIGDIIVVEELPREPSSPPVYVYSTYNDLPLSNYASAPLPNWGSYPNDYGHLRSHRDHNSEFSTKASGSFTKKYIKSITGYRFRQFYGTIYNTIDRFLTRGKFAVRGDSVFDIQENSSLMSNEVITTETGMDLVPGEADSLIYEKARYPNPLNVPKKREQDDNYSYKVSLPLYLDRSLDSDFYNLNEEDSNPYKFKTYSTKLKVKNYFSYQPIVDKNYLEYLKANASSQDEDNLIRNLFDRELPAAEEYQIAIRGNNKLLIQDQYGNGEQLLITLKNQYDAGFSIIHNNETGNIRLRDHLGQGVLIEGDPNAPRVITWTTERQFIDMGSVRQYDADTGDVESFGEYVYIRNGSVYGRSDVSFGRFSEDDIDRNDVPQQEFALINAKNASGFSNLLSGLSSRLSSGMNTLISQSSGNGLFFRNNHDPKSTNQTLSMFNNYDNSPVLTTKVYQEHQGGDVQSYLEHVVTGDSSKSEIFNKKSSSSMKTTTLVNDSNSQTNVTNIFDGTTRNTFKMDKDAMLSTQYTSGGDAANKIEQTSSNINIQRITPEVNITLTGKAIKIQGETVDIEQI